MTGVDATGTWCLRPSPALRPLVPRIWAWQTPAGPAGTHQGVASAHLTLILCLDGAVELVRAPRPDGGVGRFASMVAGLHAPPAVIATGEPQAGMQLDLTWHGARRLLGLPAAELAGDVVALATLLPGAVSLLDRLHSASDWAARCAQLDAELCRVVAARDRPSAPVPEVDRAWELLLRSGGTARVDRVAAAVGWSPRRLGDQLRRETGLGTKTAARVIRFERACTILRSTAPPALVDLATTCGYADQQHLARDFRELAGTSAVAWLAERSTADSSTT